MCFLPGELWFCYIFKADDDREFVAKSDDDEDVIDSDFSIDENDEVKSGSEDDAPKRKKRGIDTKAYKVCLVYFNIFSAS